LFAPYPVALRKTGVTSLEILEMKFHLFVWKALVP